MCIILRAPDPIIVSKFYLKCNKLDAKYTYLDPKIVETFLALINIGIKQ